MLDERSTQRARRGRFFAVLAMHVPNPDIHTSWRFRCHRSTLPFSSQVKQRKYLLVVALP